MIVRITTISYIFCALDQTKMSHLKNNFVFFVKYLNFRAKNGQNILSVFLAQKFKLTLRNDCFKSEWNYSLCDFLIDFQPLCTTRYRLLFSCLKDSSCSSNDPIFVHVCKSSFCTHRPWSESHKKHLFRVLAMQIKLSSTSNQTPTTTF